MVGNKSLILIAAIFLMPMASAISFDASIQSNTTFSERQINYKENVSQLQEVNLSLINTGSIGCSVRIVSVFNNSERAYSQEKPLWAGENTYLELSKIFKDAGVYEGALYLEYCGQRKELEQFNFTAEGLEENLTEINSTTMEANKDFVNVSVPVNEGLLVPETMPHYWKVSSGEVVNGTASIDLEAPIFDRSETVRFTLYNRSSGSSEAFTQVSMQEVKPETTFLDRIVSKIRDNSLVLVSASIAFNLLLLGILLRAKSSWLKEVMKSEN